MNLRPEAREFYVLQITTDPQLTGWQASFDAEVTWVDAELVSPTVDVFRWLVSGPDFDGTGFAMATASALPLGKTVPIVRAADNPEVVYRKAPGITVKA